jgi:ribulose-5-phosphate 4-epimerase/fuculose-1-phosphate aldolase
VVLRALSFEALRAEVADALRTLERGRLVRGTEGNVSAIDRRAGLVVISPTSLAYESLSADDVSVVRLDGELLEGKPPSVELPGHLAVYAARPDVGAVVHTHSPAATALAEELDTVAGVPVAPPAPSGDSATGHAVVAAAAGGHAAIVRGHGPFCLGRHLSEALQRAFELEEAARATAAPAS